MIINLLFSATSALPLLWPQPQNHSFGQETQVDPCQVVFKVSTVPLYLAEIAAFFRLKAFNCLSEQSTAGTYSLNVFIAPSAGNQNYTLNLTGSNWQLKAAFYPGYVRGLQTFTQLFKEDPSGWKVSLPTVITDYPDFPWRAVMIDSSRHFIPMQKIYDTLDGMAYNKLNVLHWHISDHDSFPLEIKSIPNLTKYGSFPGQFYTQEQAKNVVDYALRRGIRVIPQIDSPAHAYSWGASLDNSSFLIKCGLLNGQFDPTMDQTYQWMASVMAEVFAIFPDQIVHLGGDEPDYDCWAQRPSIADFMSKNNIASYKALADYYRNRQKTILRQLNSSKKYMYWGVSNDQTFTSQDLVDWWGNQGKFTADFGNRSNTLVVGFYDRAYLDVGFWGYDKTRTWRTVYQTNLGWVGLKAKLIGLQVCLWSQISNPQTHMQKLFPRASAAAQRGWNTAIFKTHGTTNYTDVSGRLSEQVRRMRMRGLKSSPVTVQLCERSAEICFK